MKYIQPIDRNQYQLMSSLEDLVSAEHPVRIIDSIVDSIVLSNRERFELEKENEAGRPAYHPTMHLKLYLYGYFNGISSSRKIEVETIRNKEVIWLLGGLTPDHWTISNYRKENGEDIKFVTKKFREFLKKNGYIKLKTVAIDGSKVKANTNREMLTKEKIEIKLEGLDKKMEEYLSKLAENDSRDDIKEEIEFEGVENVNMKYVTKIAELKKQVEKLERQKKILEEQTGREYISSADTDARLMKSRDGKIPAYNVQIAVDAENKMIADSEVVTDETDFNQLPQMIESIKEELGQAPEEAIADKGYSALDLIEDLEKKEKGLQVYVSQCTTKRDKEEIKFHYNKQEDEYECSAGKRLVLFTKNKKDGNSLVNIYRGIECEGCPLRNKCTDAKKHRTYKRHINEEWREAYRAKMNEKISQGKLAKRKTIVEHPFGTIKYLMGKIPILLRGLSKVQTELNIYTTVYNLKRLINIRTFDDLLKQIENYNWETA